MKFSKRKILNWIVSLGFYLAFTMAMAVSAGERGPVYETSSPLCLPLADMQLQLQAAATYPAFSGSSGPTMKYGLSPRPDAEAEFLAFTMRDSLLANNADYERIRRDLASIRQLHPQMQSIRYSGNYADGELLVTLIAPVNPLISTAQYKESNRFLRLCEEDRFASFIGYDVARLFFPARMNMNVLAESYQPLFMPNLYGLSSPNDISGLEDFIRVFSASQIRGAPFAEVNTTFNYEFEDGWLDCIDGCECKLIHKYETEDNGDVFYINTIFVYLYGWEQICLDNWPAG